ncbi:hypothetical protein [Siminovitchia sp. 179-K 8D1 HS]|uniref:hypothetical protein n=1 Tax=Siminovitchia sp. 179-K 8D1 HS TaxID=3142385 RepID=UPI0039A1AB6A
MLDLFLQDSFAEWLVPLTILIMWMISLGIISLSSPVNTQNHYQNIKKDHIVLETAACDEPAPRRCLLLIKTVRRKVSPDDADGHGLLLFK